MKILAFIMPTLGATQLLSVEGIPYTTKPHNWEYLDINKMAA